MKKPARPKRGPVPGLAALGRIAAGVAAALVISLAVAVAPAQAANVAEAEPNATSASAQSVAFGTTVKGTFGARGDCDNNFYDCDYYRVVAQQSGRLGIDLRFSDALGTSGSLTLTVLNAAGATTHTVTVSTADYDGSRLRSLVITVDAGVNYISLKTRVDGFGGGYVFSNQPYTIGFSLQPGVVETEPNGTSATADLLQLGRTVTGASFNGDCNNNFYDCDYYRIQLAAAAPLSIDFRIPCTLGTSTPYEIDVYDNAGNQLTSTSVGSADCSGAALRSRPVSLPAGNAYLRVYTRAGGVAFGQAYTLTVSTPIVGPKPTIAGNATVGAVLTAQAGTWTPAPVTLAYQWKRGGAAIAGATGTTYRLVPADNGAAISVTVTGSKTGSASVSQTSASVSVAGPQASRLSGADRFETSAQISRSNFGAGVPVAYIASGVNFPDALSGAPVAALRKGPVLLTSPGALPGATVAELQRLRPASIVVLGGTSAVSAAVEKQLARFTTTVKRIAGDNRYATSAKISASYFGSKVPTAYIASGLNFPDALSGAPAAAAGGGPVLLTASTAVPAEIRAELARLKPSKIVVLGGTGSISASVEAALHAYSATVTRYAGDSRYDTAAVVSAKTAKPGVATVYIASGAGFPDALSGAPVAGRNRSPIVLTASDWLPASVQAELTRLRPKSIVVLGGPGAVNEAVRLQLARFIYR